MAIEINQLKHLKFEEHQNEYMVTLIDLKGFEIVKGYGSTSIDALNDLHHQLL